MGIRILIADDHGIVRQGLNSLLGNQPDMEIVGEADDGQKAIDLVRELQPDVVLMDISMPNMNGIDATRLIVREFPKVRVVALSMHSNSIFVSDMVKAGASGYLLKDCLFDELVEAVRTINDGEVYLSPAIVSVVLGDYVKQLTGKDDSPLDTLSEREQEVLQLISQGKNTQEIAMQLRVSAKAIEASRRKIMEKLRSHDVADHIKWAILGNSTSLQANTFEQ